MDGFIGPCLAGCADADCDVRQAAVYGVGVMAQNLGQSFNPHAAGALQALASVIQSPAAREARPM